MILLATSVGSFPKPEYLIAARAKFARKEISKEELAELERQATREWIEFQNEIGVDILVDGEMYRGDMVTYFAENFDGFKISGLVRSYGNRYYRKPVAVSEIRRANPVTVEWFKFAQGLTEKPVKGMLTGPYTMMDWSFNEFYPSRRDFCLRLAEVVHEEAKDLEAAGAKYIQIDEPAISARPEELGLAIEAMGIVTNGLRAKTLTHICYGDFNRIYPKMLEIPVDQIDLELANSGFELLKIFEKKAFTPLEAERPAASRGDECSNHLVNAGSNATHELLTGFTKEIGLGVVDVHTHRIETVEEIKTRVRKALEIIPAAQIYIDPDCGLKTRTVDEAKDKMRVMMDAVRELREELA